MADLVQTADRVLQERMVKTEVLDRKDRTEDHVQIEDRVQNVDRDLQDQKAKTADQDQKDKNADLVQIEGHVQNVDQDLQDRKVKTVDRDQKGKIVQTERRQPQMEERQLLNHSRRKRSLNQDLREMVQRLPLKLSLGFIFLLELLFFACSDSGVLIDESHNFPTTGWIQKQPLQFKVNIPVDSASYALYVVVRQNNSYPFYNLYFSPSILDESGKTLQRGLAEAILYDPKTGKPKGAGFGDIYEKKFLVYPSLKFPKKGVYNIRIEQSMRVDTLTGMASFGLRLEKN